MSIQTEIDRIKGNIASAYTAASGKGATLPDVQNSANLAGCIDTITGGGGEPAEEWQPNPNWWDIRKILDEDTRDYAGKVGVILYNFNDVSDFTLSSSGRTAVATSDGAFYSYADNGANVSHNWDTTQDKDDGRGFKTRWAIYYYTTNTTGDTFAGDSAGMGWTHNNIAYLVLRINWAGQNLCAENYLLEGIDNVGFVANGSFRYCCSNCYSLQKLPDNLDTSRATTFNNFLQNCYSLRKLPDVLDTSKGTSFISFCEACSSLQKLPDVLDVSSGTNFNGFLQDCFSLQKVPDVLDTSKGTDFSYFCSNCYSLREVPDVLDVSSGTKFSGFLQNCYSLQKLPDVLDTSKGTNMSYFLVGLKSVQKSPAITMASSTTSITSKYAAPFYNSTRLVEIPLTLPSNTNFWLDSSTRISIESFRYIADYAPDVTATPRKLTIGSTNIIRINAEDPTIITDLQAKGWTVA